MTTDLEYELTEEHYAIAERNGINRRNAYQRFYSYGWSVERTISTPATGKGTKPGSKADEYMKLAESNGIPYKTYYSRVRYLGWSKERAANTPVILKGRDKG